MTSGVEHQLKKRKFLADKDSPSKVKRDLNGRPNGTLDAYYGCFILEELVDYALNFSKPWSEHYETSSLVAD